MFDFLDKPFFGVLIIDLTRELTELLSLMMYLLLQINLLTLGSPPLFLHLLYLVIHTDLPPILLWLCLFDSLKVDITILKWRSLITSNLLVLKLILEVNSELLWSLLLFGFAGAWINCNGINHIGYIVPTGRFYPTFAKRISLQEIPDVLLTWGDEHLGQVPSSIVHFDSLK